MYHISVTLTVQPAALKNIIEYINNYRTEYDLNNYNCTDFALDIAALGGLDLPRTVGHYNAGLISFQGRNPGDLGMDILAGKTPPGGKRNQGQANAPKKSGGCN